MDIALSCSVQNSHYNINLWLSRAQIFDLTKSYCFFYMQVAERSLFLWNNDHIENLIKQNRKVILPIILPSLERNTKIHWNQAVRSLTLNVRKIFSDADPEFFEECLSKFQEDESKKEEIKTKREAIWKRLEEIAEKRSGSGTTNQPMLFLNKVTNG